MTGVELAVRGMPGTPLCGPQFLLLNFQGGQVREKLKMVPRVRGAVHIHLTMRGGGFSKVRFDVI